MRTEQRDRVLAAADNFARELNNIGFQETVVEGRRLFLRLAELMEPIQTREQVLQVMDATPDLSAKDEKLILMAFKYGRHIFRLGLLALLADVVKGLPRPPGGRKKMFTVQEETEVCEFISDLILKKVDLPLAYERTALHFGCSRRSVRRLWEDRDEIAEEIRNPSFDDTLHAVRAFLSDPPTNPGSGAE